MLAGALAAQTPGSPAGTPPRGPAQLLLDDASAEPVEIFADLTFRVVDKLPDKDKRAALEQVFRRAGEARQPFPLVRASIPSREPGPTQSAAHGQAANLEQATALSLDALSLRCRAVRRLLKIDPKLGRDLFEQIARPEPPRPPCESEFVPDTRIYIEVLAEVAASDAFTREEREKQVPLFLVERGARGAPDSLEIVAAAKAFPSFAHNDKEAQIIASALAASLSLSDSDRGFTSAARRGSLAGAVLTANAALRAAGSPEALLPALRAYLVRHLTAARCRDSFMEPPGGFEAMTPEYRDWAVKALAQSMDGVAMAFNSALGKRTDVAPVSMDESKPAKLEGEVKSSDYANGAEFEALLNEVTALGKVNPGESLWKVRLTPDWAFRARQALSKIEDWEGAPGQDPIELFHQKFQAFFRIFDAAPAGETHRNAMDEMMRVLEDPDPLNRAPAEWLSELHTLMAYSGISPEAVNAIRESGAEGFAYQTGLEIPNAMTASRSAALPLYGRAWLLEIGGRP